MLGSKIKTALQASILFTFGFWLLFFFSEGELFSFFLIVVFLYCLFGNVIYGIPVSLLSEFLTRNLAVWRFPASAFFHTFLAALTYFIMEGFAYYAVIAAVLFFLVDEWRKWDREMPGGRRITLNTAGLLIACLLPAGFFWMLQQADLEEKTNDLYLIPKGYAGQVRIVHEIENAPAPETEGEYDVFRVNDRGYAITSLPQSEGYIEDLYYYVDDKGKREPIPDSCISHGGAGGVQGDGYDYSYTYFSVGCEEDIAGQGNGPGIEDILYEEGLINQTFD